MNNYTKKTTDNHGNTFHYNDKDQFHRTDGPAVEGADGTREWYLDGKRHRTDGPAIEWEDGSKSWWVDDKLHRTDGPAIEWVDGHKEWHIDGKRHRTDGPAVERANGDKELWVEGKELTEEEFNERTNKMNKQADEKISDLTVTEQATAWFVSQLRAAEKDFDDIIGFALRYTADALERAQASPQACTVAPVGLGKVPRQGAS